MDEPVKKLRVKNAGIYFWAIPIFLFAVALRAAAGLLFPNIIWPDEIFQTLEPAHKLAFGNGITSWEWEAGVRSWIYPGILAVMMKITAWMGNGSSGYMTAIILFNSILSASLVLVVFFRGLGKGSLQGAVVASMVCAVWFELLFFGPKALTEVVATYLMIAGLFLSGPGLDDGKKPAIIAGAFLLGLSSCLRIQLLPATVLTVVCMAVLHRKKVIVLFAGFAAAFLIAGMLDWLTWSYPFQSFVLYFKVNIIDDIAKSYGTKTWSGYFSVMLDVWGWFLPAILILALIGARRNFMLFIADAAVMITHVLIPHKEYRFIFPSIAMTIVLAALGTGEIISMIQRRSNRAWIAIAASIIAVSAWTAASFTLSRDYTCNKTDMTPFITMIPGISNWERINGHIRTMDLLSTDDAACGLALSGNRIYKIDVYATGGFSHLHKKIPLIRGHDPVSLKNKSAYFNRILAPCEGSPGIEGFNLSERFSDGSCLYVSDKGCEKLSDDNVNRFY